MDTKYYTQFRTEHAIWIEHNFSGSKAYQPLLGMVEEIGELAEANLQLDDNKERDAIGDILVYLTHYCNFYLLDWWECQKFANISWSILPNLLDISIQIGKLAHAQLKGEQSIRHTAEQIFTMKKVTVGNIVVLLDHYCKYTGRANVLGCLQHAWDEVKHRDWKKNNQTGSK